MRNFLRLSIIHPLWENRKSEAYLLFRGGEKEKFKDKLKGILLRLISILIVEYNCIIKLLLSLLFIDNLSMPDLNVHNSVTYDINTEVTCKSHNSLRSLITSNDVRKGKNQSQSK